MGFVAGASVACEPVGCCCEQAGLCVFESGSLGAWALAHSMSRVHRLQGPVTAVRVAEYCRVRKQSACVYAWLHLSMVPVWAALWCDAGCCNL